MECEKLPTFDWIIDSIYLGDLESALSKELLIQNKIGLIINLSNTRYIEYENIQYIHIDIEDHTDTKISDYFEMIDEEIKKNQDKRILIHCMNSVSRSVTIVLNYLMRKMNLKESYEYLKSRRNQYTRPNKGFVKQLLEKEKLIYGENSIKLKDFFH